MSSTAPHPPSEPPSGEAQPAAGRTRRPRLGRYELLVALLLVDACVLGLHLANELSGRGLSQVDLEEEQNLPTWVSTLQLGGAFVLAAVLARLASGRTRLALALFAAIFAFLSLDELALVHEQVIQKATGSVTADPWYWPVFYTPLALALGLATIGVALEGRRVLGSIFHVLVPLALLGTAIGLDVVATQLRGSPFVFGVAVLVEETCELAGGALLVFVLFRMLSARLGGGARQAAPPRRGRPPPEAGRRSKLSASRAPPRAGKHGQTTGRGDANPDPRATWRHRRE